MSTILPWRSRLAAMDHTKGTSNKMVYESMLAEINEWRRCNSPLATDLARSYREKSKLQGVITALRAELRKERAQVKGRTRALDTLRTERDTWKTMAMKYRKQVLEKS